MTIAEFDHIDKNEKRKLLFKCCGSTNWVKKMLGAPPFYDFAHLLQYADEKWQECTEQDWLEAFTHHPKIGDKKLLREKFAATAAWASNEQSGVNNANDDIIDALAKGNVDYENKFGYIFIVCATGKSAVEMLELLMVRLNNDPAEEIKIAANEQSKITAIRLNKLFE